MHREIIKVGLVEDQHLFMEGVKVILGNYPNIEVIFESPDGFSVLEKLEQASNWPDVMLVDLSLPAHNHEEYNGWRVIQELRMRYPEIKCLVLTVHNDPYLMAKLIEEGACGYLLKDSSPQEMHEAIVAVYERGSYINAASLEAIQRKMQGGLKKPQQGQELTRRELEVLKLVCQQMTAEEIANELFISVKTVNGHRNNLLQKTGSKNVTGLVMYAVKHRLVELA